MKFTFKGLIKGPPKEVESSLRLIYLIRLETFVCDFKFKNQKRYMRCFRGTQPYPTFSSYTVCACFWYILPNDSGSMSLHRNMNSARTLKIRADNKIKHNTLLIRSQAYMKESFNRLSYNKQETGTILMLNVKNFPSSYTYRIKSLKQLKKFIC